MEFDDWDDDGDQDLFAGLTTGTDEYINQFAVYENITKTGGLVTFAERGLLKTAKGSPLGSQWFASMKITDWDSDGRKDIIASCKAPKGERTLNEYHFIRFYRNLGADDPWKFNLADGVNIQAGGKDINIHSPDIDCADIDGDGDLDLFASTQGSEVFFYENKGTKADSALAEGREIPCLQEAGIKGGGHTGITVADFTSDGLLDYLVGHLWLSWPEDRYMHRNVGTRQVLEFERADAYNGAPCTEEFQKCYMGRQNVVRAVDWNNDGRTDLIATREQTDIFYFENKTNHLAPIFKPGRLILSYEQGAGRCCICDWNNDGKKDIVAATNKGWLNLFLNKGADEKPEFAEANRLYANGKPVDGTLWSNVLVCDWDSDGKKDVIFGMGGAEGSKYYDWPHQHENPILDTGFLFYRNTGTDAEPNLAYPKWVTAGDHIISYTRPNVGSFVDWDGDGKKDFIACEFENVIHLYKNVGSGERGAEPQFAELEGTILIKPWTAMLISGVHVVDWNRDGDVDIVTGQGHGGSGLRFFEHDYIEDCISGTHPLVSVGGFSARMP